MNTPDLARSFPPIADARAKILILGSMPGVASLTAGRYYAHPRNAFWPIMGELFGAGPELPYHDRCRVLQGSGVAVWDVLKECRREGSLDTSIEKASEQPNDFAIFFTRCPRIERIYFNGQKAEAAFRRHVASTLPRGLLSRLLSTRLPSTSPAHAGKRYDEKLEAWSAIVRNLAANRLYQVPPQCSPE